MDIIHAGEWNTPRTIEIECKDIDCKAKLKVHESDIIAPDHREQTVFKCVCVVCGADNYIDAPLISRRLRDKLNKKRAAPYRSLEM